MVRRIAQALAAAALVMLLAGAAAFYLASLDKPQPKNPRFMVEVLEVRNG